MMFGVGEEPSERGLHAEHLEEPRRHVHREEPLRFAASGQRVAAVAEEGEVGAHILERTIAVAELLEPVDLIRHTAQSALPVFAIQTSRSAARETAAAAAPAD